MTGRKAAERALAALDASRARIESLERHPNRDEVLRFLSETIGDVPMSELSRNKRLKSEVWALLGRLRAARVAGVDSTT